MSYTITLLPGDGIGPEVVGATLPVLEATGVEIQWEEQQAGLASMDAEGTPLPERVLDSIRTNKVALKGPLTTPVGSGFKSVNVQLRQKLDLYANVRPSITLPAIETPFKNVDLTIFRENTEGLYSGIESFDERLRIADSTARITEAGSERIIRFCFEYARRNHKRRVTIVHKANILKLSSGLFLRIGREVAEEYPEIEFDDRIVDNMCMQLVMRPSAYDCIVTTNLFGDIMSDLAAGLVGGLGMVAGANVGDRYAVFEPVHGSAPDIAGQGIANPTAEILAAEMMLRHLGEGKAADAVRGALIDVLKAGEVRTPDIGGTASTEAFGARVADRVAERMQSAG